MAKRTKKQTEKILMVVNVKREIIDILQITNRRFMYNPQTGTLILGDEMYGKSICSSHSQEFYASKAEGRFDDYRNSIAYTGSNMIILVQITRPLKEAHKHIPDAVLFVALGFVVAKSNP